MLRESLQVAISTMMYIAIFYSLFDSHTGEDVSYPTNTIFVQAAEDCETSVSLSIFMLIEKCFGLLP